MEGMRRALAALGNDAMPLDIQAYLKKEFGIKMETILISNYKSALKSSGKSAVMRKPWAGQPQKPPMPVASAWTMFGQSRNWLIGSARRRSRNWLRCWASSLTGLVLREGGPQRIGLFDVAGCNVGACLEAAWRRMEADDSRTVPRVVPAR